MIGCVILAAGRSLRFGEQEKLLATFHGKPMLAGVLDAVCGVDALLPLAVVHNEPVRALIEARGIPTVYNPQPENGISGSIRIGLTKLTEGHDLSACLFAVADQPYLTAASIQSMLTQHRAEPEHILALSYEGRRGNPVLFPRYLFPQLLQLTGDVGGSTIIKANPNRVVLVQAKSVRELYDFDTVQAVQNQEAE